MNKELYFKKIYKFDLLSRIPWGLEVVRKSDNKVFKPRIRDIDLIINTNEYAPLLYPIDSIHLPLIHQGKEVIPLVELAQECFNDLKFHIDENGDCISETLTWGGYCVFNYTRDYGFSYMMIGGKNEAYTLEDSWRLYEMMVEYQIDYKGLIDDFGVALDKDEFIRGQKLNNYER